MTGVEHLSVEQKSSLIKTLSNYKDLFTGSLGNWVGKPIKLKLKPDAVPVLQKPYGIPHYLIEEVKAKVVELESLNII